MIDTKFKLEYESREKADDSLPVIIVAAGSSARMSGINKQFLKIGEIPVIARTVSAFESSPLISDIIIVTKDEYIPEIQKIVFEYNFKKVSDITVGGDSRFMSVLNGISRLKATDRKVLIHDGARPFVDSEIIGNVVAGLQNSECAVCAVPLKDTVKIVDENHNVISTPDRNRLYSCQTPQGVDVDLYKKSAELIEKPENVTDDACVMESGGYNVKIVPGKFSNIKITTPDDIKLAEFLSLED